MEGLMMDDWLRLEGQERLRKMKELAYSLPDGFSFEGLRTFERWGRRLETGVFAYGSSRFVFVPGDRASLGWAGGEERLDPQFKNELLENLEAYEIDDAEAFLRQMTSPARDVEIGPLLVECEARQAGWRELEAQEVRNDPKLCEDLETFRISGHSGVTVHKTLRLERAAGGTRVFRFRSEDFGTWMAEWAVRGLRLPTEDEWEYLYAAGSRSVFPWGDRFDYAMKLRHLEKRAEEYLPSDQSLEDRAGRPYDLEQDNAFGVRFAGDPYVYELTLDASGAANGLRAKGGDGGGLICGGEGPLLGYLPTAMIAYRDSESAGESTDWEELASYSVYRRVLSIAYRTGKGGNAGDNP